MLILLIASILPAAMVALIWLRLLASQANDFKRITMWFAMVLVSASAGMGLWGLIHISQLQQRSFYDYGFERHAFNLASLALIAALAWLFRSRSLFSWVTVATSLVTTLFWAGACMTL